MGVGPGARMAGQSIFLSQILSPFGIRSTKIRKGVSRNVAVPGAVG